MTFLQQVIMIVSGLMWANVGWSGFKVQDFIFPGINKETSMPNFKGEYDYTIDTKGRMNIPANFRDFLPPEAKKTFVVTRGLDKCLAVYTLDVWEKFEEKLRQLPPQARHYVRIVTSQARETKMDEQGRILIPKNLLQWAEIDSKVTVVGALDQIELWNPERFEQYKEQNQDALEKISEEFQV